MPLVAVVVRACRFSSGTAKGVRTAMRIFFLGSLPARLLLNPDPRSGPALGAGICDGCAKGAHDEARQLSRRPLVVHLAIEQR
jgi:hypothetical protein